MSSYFDHNGHDILMPPYVSETYWTTSYFFSYDSLKSASSAEICGESVTRTSSALYPLLRWRGVIFLCIQLPNSNAISLGVVHSGIKMIGRYFSESRLDEKCSNSLHKYKDYSKTHPLPQYAQMIKLDPQYTVLPQMVLWRVTHSTRVT